PTGSSSAGAHLPGRRSPPRKGLPSRRIEGVSTMHRALRVLATVCMLAAITLIAGATAASAHAQRQAGPIHMEIGLGTEPAYIGQPNSVQIILTEHGQPVVDLGGSLNVQVSFGGQQTDIPLEADFEVG